jgi:hypothetical protein
MWLSSSVELTDDDLLRFLFIDAAILQTVVFSFGDSSSKGNCARLSKDGVQGDDDEEEDDEEEKLEMGEPVRIAPDDGEVDRR